MTTVHDTTHHESVDVARAREASVDNIDRLLDA
jgi:hypothetical protein